MNSPDPISPFPKDKDQILRDFTLAQRLKDIREVTQLKDRLAPKWWESIIIIIQFAGSLGLLASVVQYPPLRYLFLGNFLIFWMALTILSIVLGFELVIVRLHHLRQAFQVHSRMIDELTKCLSDLEARIPKDE
jgi:hypothetical protein